MKVILPLIMLILLPILSFADSDKSLEQRVTALEQRNAELYHKLEEKKAAVLVSKLAERISLSGLLEVEASLQQDDYAGNTDTSSDLVLSTAQFGIAAEANDFVSGDLILLYEEGENNDNVTVDEATINFAYASLTSRLGKQYVPFGNFHSYFISDPLTLELGETQEVAVTLGYQYKNWSVTGFVFKGDSDQLGGEDHVRDFGVSISFSPLENLEIGASYMSDLADSDAEIVGVTYTDRVSGYSAYLIAGYNNIFLSAEILGAVDEFDDADGGAQPLAWNIEVAKALNDAFELAVRIEGSEEIDEMPELQYGACVSWFPLDQLSLSLEYLRGEFDQSLAPKDDAMNSQESRDLVTAQLAYEF